MERLVAEVRPSQPVYMNVDSCETLNGFLLNHQDFLEILGSAGKKETLDLPVHRDHQVSITHSIL